MKTKKCSKCNEKKELYEFYKRKDTKSGYRMECKECRWKQIKWYREKNPDIHLENTIRKYGITSAQFKRMIKNQSNKCAICKSTETTNIKGTIKRLAVDHCHKTGKVRELLCDKCNRGIGYLKDNIKFLKSAIKYLEKHG